MTSGSCRNSLIQTLGGIVDSNYLITEDGVNEPMTPGVYSTWL